MPNNTPPKLNGSAPKLSLLSDDEQPWWTLEANKLLAQTSLPHALTDLGVIACAVLAKALQPTSKVPDGEKRQLAERVALKMASHAQPRQPPPANVLDAPRTPEPQPMSDEVQQALAAYGLPTTRH